MYAKNQNKASCLLHIVTLFWRDFQNHNICWFLKSTILCKQIQKTKCVEKKQLYCGNFHHVTPKSANWLAVLWLWRLKILHRSKNDYNRFNLHSLFGIKHVPVMVFFPFSLQCWITVFKKTSVPQWFGFWKLEPKWDMVSMWYFGKGNEFFCTHKIGTIGFSAGRETTITFCCFLGFQENQYLYCSGIGFFSS